MYSITRIDWPDKNQLPLQVFEAVYAIPFCRADEQEADIVHNSDLPSMVLYSLRRSEEAHLVYRNGRPCAVFGIADSNNCGHPAQDRVGIPWMVSDGLLVCDSTRFLRESLRIIDRWFIDYNLDRMVQYVWDRHWTSIKYLKFMGFLPTNHVKGILCFTKHRTEPSWTP